jgi:hypothetical protein
MADKKFPPKTNKTESEEVIPTKTLAESDNYVAWLSTEPDGELVYHLELGPITLHFFQEEWEELLALVSVAEKNL